MSGAAASSLLANCPSTSPMPASSGSVRGGSGNSGFDRGVGLGWLSDLAAGVELRRVHPCPTEEPMTKNRLPLADLLTKAGKGDFLCGVASATAGHFRRCG